MKILYNQINNELNIDIYFKYDIESSEIEEAIASKQFYDPDNILDRDMPIDWYKVSQDSYLWQKESFLSFCDSIDEWVSDLIEPNSLMRKFDNGYEKENISVVPSENPDSIETCYIHFVIKSTKSNKPSYYVTIRISSHPILNEFAKSRKGHEEYWKNYYEVKKCVPEYIDISGKMTKTRYRKFIHVLDRVREIIEEYN